MSKSRGNAIAIGATADETARLIAGARTDAGRDITYVRRSARGLDLVLFAAPLPGARAGGRAEIGGRGSQALKGLVTDAVNERFREHPHTARRVIADRGRLRRVLGEGTARARDIADEGCGRSAPDAHGLPRDRVYAACAASASSRCSPRQDSVIATVRQSAMTASDITAARARCR